MIIWAPADLGITLGRRLDVIGARELRQAHRSSCPVCMNENILFLDLSSDPLNSHSKRL
jgi:hypothetical protein